MSQTDIDRIIGQVTRRLLMVLLPTIIMSIGGVFLHDHFALANKADRETVHADMFDLQLMMEAKVRAMEDIANANRQDIGYINKKIEEFDRINDRINEMIIKEFGVNRGIPELSTN